MRPGAMVHNAQSFSLSRGNRTGSSQACLWPNSAKQSLHACSSPKCHPQGPNRKAAAGEGRWAEVLRPGELEGPEALSGPTPPWVL